jgi:GNAT superfamily N-acetyltransferase
VSFWKRKPTSCDLEIKSVAPDAATLVSFYAGLSEPAELKAVAEAFPAGSGDTNLVVLSAWSNEQFVGVLRAAKKPGIIYDISVRSDYWGRGVGTRLRDELKKSTRGENIDWKGYPFRVAASLDRDLNMIRTVYGISLIFGFQKIVEWSYVLLASGGAASLSTKVKLLLLPCLAFAVLAVGIRFFWAADNIRRFVLRRIVTLNPPKRWHIVIIHFPLLFSHAVLFFFLCRIFQDICERGLQQPDGAHFILTYTTLLFLNIGWLASMLNKKEKGPESLWFYNNLYFAVAGGACFLIFWHCHVAAWLALSISAVLVLLNSVIDLAWASRAYILRPAGG